MRHRFFRKRLQRSTTATSVRASSANGRRRSSRSPSVLRQPAATAAGPRREHTQPPPSPPPGRRHPAGGPPLRCHHGPGLTTLSWGGPRRSGRCRRAHGAARGRSTHPHARARGAAHNEVGATKLGASFGTCGNTITEDARATHASTYLANAPGQNGKRQGARRNPLVSLLSLPGGARARKARRCALKYGTRAKQAASSRARTPRPLERPWPGRCGGGHLRCGRRAGHCSALLGLLWQQTLHLRGGSRLPEEDWSIVLVRR